jgi:hypothetical protein
MKKIIAALALLCVFAAGAFGQTMVNVKTFATYYGFINGNIDFNNKYTWDLEDEDDEVFGSLEGKEELIDSAKEWFLAMACGTSRIRVTDAAMAARIESVLPSNNPKQRDLQAGAAVFQEIQILRFLNASGGSADTAAVNRHEAVLQYITGRGNATRAEIEAFYRNNIRALVSQVVDEEAAKRQPTNPTFVAEIKQITTDFFLNPTMENHNVLYQKQRQYASTDGQRGINTSFVFVYAIAEFNSRLSDTVINPSILASKQAQ